ncbi:alpha/beta hydrolase [Pedobacter sp. MC2016-14]|uniref:alpha/beta hydrolase n=1 Tax=Pedobacter sp. MC2016-14 TaxID=2897327 RepID=UPI001E37558B|nr:alpha/beta hydrolase [Pedobacter sp. MC2016-14]MCD0488845.1 alpha/beta hydrolase [Pedobacter sp. MC2016-14]
MKNILLLIFMIQISTSFAGVKVKKDINYTVKNDLRRQLNVYYKKGMAAKEVVVFIHGGSWSTGKKDIYWWLARNLARKGMVAVTINYRLAPEVQYREMAQDCADAVGWVVRNIPTYGGNPDKIFLMGHSAGAHLAELINADPQYFLGSGINTNPVKGLILNDPFGLDMLEYLSKAEKDGNYYNFLHTFSADPAVWEMGSPLHYADQIRNPHLIFYGSKTYPAIQLQSRRMYDTLLAQHIKAELHVIKNKKHVGMITQMIFGRNPLYTYILEFIRGTGKKK